MLTIKQIMVAKFICDYIVDNLNTPTGSEIGEFFGFTKSGGCDHLKRLADKGYLEPGGKSQSYRVTEKFKKLFGLSVVAEERELPPNNELNKLIADSMTDDIMSKGEV